MNMEQCPDMQQVIYDILLIRIECGTYRYRENLPTIEETGEQFQVSVDTARAAYSQLKRKGYISLSKNVGAKVIVQRNEQEIARYVQFYFSRRKDAFVDLVQSLRPLFGRAQYVGLRYASPETMEQMERLSQVKGELRAPYTVWKCLDQKYTALGNGLLVRLAWQVYMFLHAPFLSIEGNIRYLKGAEHYEMDTLSLCRQKDWAGLDKLIRRFQKNFSEALNQFYQEKVTIPSAAQDTAFYWDSYKKTSQLCYSLSIALLTSISRGEYPVGSFLPTAKQISLEKGVSVSTVRRAVSLLDSIGVVKSAQSLGARVLPFDESTKNSDFSQPVLQRRLVAMAESLQLFALSSREVAELTLFSLGADSIQLIRQKLTSIKTRQRYELLDYTILRLLAESAPCRAVRTVYSELLQQLFWGRSLNGMSGDQAAVNMAYGPYLDGLLESLEKPDIPQFAARLEALITYDLRQIVGYLIKLQIPGAEKILISGI